MADHQERRLPVPSTHDELYRPEDDTISLLDLLAVLAKRWRLIFFSTFIAAGLVVAFSILTLRLPPTSPWNPLPNIYKPEVKLLFQQQSGAGELSRILGSSDSPLSMLADLNGVGSGGGSAALAESLLAGSTLVDQIVREFGIIERNEYTEHPRTQARMAVEEAMQIEYESETGVLTIGFEDYDPQFATAVLDRIVELLQARFQSINMQTVSQKRRFLETRLSEIQTDLQSAQTSLLEFQQRYGVYNVDAQAEQMVEQVATLSAEIIQKEVELENLREYLSPEAPQIQRLQREIEVARRLVDDLRRGRFELAGGDLERSVLSERILQQMNLMGEVELQQNLLALTTQQLEQAKLEEQDNRRRFVILEPAEVPEMKSRPSRGMICIITTITVFFLAVFLAFVLEYFEKVKQDPEESLKLDQIRRSLPGGRRQKGRLRHEEP